MVHSKQPQFQSLLRQILLLILVLSVTSVSVAAKKKKNRSKNAVSKIAEIKPVDQKPAISSEKQDQIDASHIQILQHLGYRQNRN